MIGQIVNYRYEVLEKLGDGAFFSVYRARDKVLNRLVALKVFAKDLAADREFTAAVVEGYQSAAGLIHTSLARMYDADAGGDECFVATEYVRGINVKERVRRAGPMSVPLALDVMIPVLEALEYAHANRMVHGDLRPQDIIVSPDGEVKLTDFGLSWALDKCPGVAEKFPMRSIHYQAPEVTEGSAPTVASDLYSVGVVLYEMLTNALPFDGATAVSVALKKVRESAVAPRSINAGVPKSLSDIIMQAIDVDPRQRFQNASEMLAGLRAIREMLRTGQPARAVEAPTVAKMQRHPEEVPAESGEGSMRRSYLLLLGLFLAVVIFVGAVTWFMMRQQGEIRVPSLLGKTWEEAVSIAQQARIDLVDDGTAYSDVYKSGQICSVVPPADGTVPSNNPVVKVKISSGPSRVEVPDLVGMSEPDATETAVREGFVIGNMKQEYSDKVPVNAVISQDPAAGVRRAPNSTIDVVISSGAKPETDTTTEQPETSPERRFNVSIEVPEDADGPQDVLIKVIDDRGETTEYEEQHSPGEKFSVTVSAQGSRARIKVYVGGTRVMDVIK